MFYIILFLLLTTIFLQLNITGMFAVILIVGYLFAFITFFK